MSRKESISLVEKSFLIVLFFTFWQFLQFGVYDLGVSMFDLTYEHDPNTIQDFAG